MHRHMRDPRPAPALHSAIPFSLSSIIDLLSIIYCRSYCATIPSSSTVVFCIIMPPSIPLFVSSQSLHASYMFDLSKLLVRDNGNRSSSVSPFNVSNPTVSLLVIREETCEALTPT